MMEIVTRPNRVVRVLARGEKLDPCVGRWQFKQSNTDHRYARARPRSAYLTDGEHGSAFRLGFMRLSTTIEDA